MKKTIEFKASEKSIDKFNKWIKKHDLVCKLKKKKKPRFITYCFTPNGIGSSIVVKCSCGKGSADITSIENW